MRKPRDFNAELIALNDKTRRLKDRRIVQLGELVVATGAGTLPIEQLAGALVAAVETDDAGIKEGWRKRGAAFFQLRTTKAAGRSRGNAGGFAQDDGATPLPRSETREN